MNDRSQNLQARGRWFEPSRAHHLNSQNGGHLDLGGPRGLIYGLSWSGRGVRGWQLLRCHISLPGFSYCFVGGSGVPAGRAEAHPLR
jgi:hypothetical protein